MQKQTKGLTIGSLILSLSMGVSSVMAMDEEGGGSELLSALMGAGKGEFSLFNLLKEENPEHKGKKLEHNGKLVLDSQNINKFYLRDYNGEKSILSFDVSVTVLKRGSKSSSFYPSLETHDRTSLIMDFFIQEFKNKLTLP